MTTEARQQLIDRHDGLVREYNRLGDNITQAENDAMLEEIAFLEVVLLECVS